jgi:NADPH:quinone reductase
MPQSITAIIAPIPGGPDALKTIELPMPVPAPGELLVKVTAAGVNRPDALQRQGGYPPPPGAPATLGLEVSGTVVGLGEGAGGRFGMGAELCALVPGGGYATYALVNEANAMPVPKGVSLEDAAGIPETFMTVWTNVFERAGLKPGEVFLVHGGSSGIGTTAIMMAKALGARVFATAGSDEKCNACKELGAEVAINYRTQDFVEVIKAQTKGGADVILDMVGGSYIPRNIAAAARDGRIVSIAFLEGSKIEVDFMPVMLKRLTLTGSTLRIRPVAEKAAICRALEAQIWPHIEKGSIRPRIFARFPLEKAADAHRLLESSAHIGKILLIP